MKDTATKDQLIDSQIKIVETLLNHNLSVGCRRNFSFSSKHLLQSHALASRLDARNENFLNIITLQSFPLNGIAFVHCHTF